jgi:hypothetical protein
MAEGNPHNVTKGRQLYKAYTIHVVEDEVVFELVDTLDYLDSRSLKISRPASYNKLKRGNID